MAKRTKRIGGTFSDDATEDTVIIAGALIGVYFLVVRPIMNSFGDSTDEVNVKSQLATDPSKNPFSPSFQPFVDCYGADFIPTMMAQNKEVYDRESYIIPKSWDDFNVIRAENINDAMGYLIVYFDKVVSIFSGLQDQMSVAYIASYLQVNYQIDLLTLLNNGRWEVADWWRTGVGDTRLANIINNVNKLPVGDCSIAV